MNFETDNRTMADLRVYVAKRLHDALHGRTVDMMQAVTPELEHMLGLADIGEVAGPGHREGSILKPDHEFWDEYVNADVRTERAATEEVITAIESLREDDLFRMTYPYGEEGGIAYIEVDDPRQTSFTENSLGAICKSCGEPLSPSPNLVLTNGYYYLKASIDCDSCDYQTTVSRKLIRE